MLDVGFWWRGRVGLWCVTHREIASSVVLAGFMGAERCFLGSTSVLLRIMSKLKSFIVEG